MAKTDKSEKKIATKKADRIKKKPAVPASMILAKAKKALESSKKELADSSDSSSDSESPTVKKAADDSDNSSDSSSESEESSSEDSDTDDKKMVSVPAKASPTKKAQHSKDESTVQKAADDSDDSSDASTSEESSSHDSDADNKKKPSMPTKAPLNKVKDTSDSEGDSSDASDSGKSSSEDSEDSEEENEETSTTAQSIIPEANNKRKADSEAVAPPKKVKLANGHAEAATSSEEIKSVFVGRLSWNVDNDWLAQEFAECGEVESAHVQMDRNTGRSRGFGYVHFKTADAVEKALTLSGKEIDGRPINVDKSNPPNKKASAEKRAQAFGDTNSPPSAVLFVGNLSFGVDEDMLWETFGEHGDIKSVRIPTDRETGRPKGFAYVEFSEVGVAKTAHGTLQGLELDGRSIRLDFSQPRDNSGPRGGGQGGRGGRGRGGFGGDRGRGFSRGGRGGDRGGRGGGRGGDRGGRGRGGRGRGGIANFEGQKITF